MNDLPTMPAETDNEEELLDQVTEAAGSRLSDVMKVELLGSITQAVEAHEVDMTFVQAMQAAERCQSQLSQEKDIYGYFSGLLRGTRAMNDITTITDARDNQGRPVVARIAIEEVLGAEIPDLATRQEALRPFLAAINNYYAKRVTQWVNQLAVYTAIAAAKLPRDE